MKTIFVCDNCKRTITHESTVSTGYATNKENEKICFACCGLHDEQEFRALKPGEKIYFYFDGEKLTNWPGTFKITPYHTRNGKHNIGRTRVDAWFKFNHNLYHGVQIGEWNQVMKVTRVKS